MSGHVTLGGRRLDVAAEAATQTDTGNAPIAFRAGYVRIDAMFAIAENLSVGLGYEALGGDEDESGEAFRTPLATLHAFQGWADQFLATPDAGVEDLFASVSFARGPWRLDATWHRFTAESGDADWGGELDVSLGRRFGERYAVLLKAAHFDADDAPFTDVTKAWLMLTAAY